jgi:predicted dehydrogenase
MKALVIGFGSIGKRHARLLNHLSFDVTVVTKQSIDIFSSVTQLCALRDIGTFDYVVIANESFLHFETLKKLHDIGYRKKVLIEKPFLVYAEIDFIRDFSSCFIGYNLRFHPILQMLREIIGDNPIQQVSIYAGQYLPSWRQYHRENTYSRHRSQQGGVLNDLSHELDYAVWLFGHSKKITALGGRFSENITYDSDDAFSIIMQTDRTPLVTIQLNYFDKHPTREIILHFGETSIRANLVLNEMIINGEKKQFECSSDDMYLAQHIAVLEDNQRDLCDINQAITITQLISQIEEANKNIKWITA